MKSIVSLICIFCSSMLIAQSSEQSFNQLVQGNKRFIQGQTQAAKENQSARVASIDSQSPVAVVVACADSRVAPEIIFDQHIGELFVVRVAGNVIGPYEMESIEFAVDQLQTPCVIVMGHQNCGAVNAVIQGQIQDIPFIAKQIKPSVIKAKASNSPNLLKTSIKMNAQKMAGSLTQSPIINQIVKQGNLKIYPAYYDFSSGQVQFLKH